MKLFDKRVLQISFIPIYFKPLPNICQLANFFEGCIHPGVNVMRPM